MLDYTLSIMLQLLQSLQFRLLFTEHCIVGTEWDYKNVLSPFSRILIVTGGDGYVWHHKQKFHLTPGTMHLIPSYTLSHYKTFHSLESIYILFTVQTGEGMSIYQFLNPDFHVQTKGHDIDQAMHMVSLNPGRQLRDYDPEKYDNKATLHSFNDQNTIANIPAFIETQGIIQQFFARFMTNTSPRPTEKIETFQRLFKSIQYITEHLDKPIRVKDLADMSYYSTDHYSKIFLDIMGLRPIEYINRKRIEKAELLLLTTPENIENISAMCGIPNTSYFQRLFKKYKHVTPAKYRKEKYLV